MTLLTTVFAAIITTIIWYSNENRSTLNLGTLCLIYWGTSIMWFVDAIMEFVEKKAAYFTSTPADTLNDLILGLSAVALGLIIWLILLLYKDPKGILRKTLLHNK